MKPISRDLSVKKPPMKNNMKKIVYIITACSVILFLFFCVLYIKTDSGAVYSAAVTFGTVSYHFVMRLIVGMLINLIMKNRADLTKKRYQCTKWEEKLYKLLKVKKWNKHMPTFDRDFFDMSRHSPDEVAQAMCQAEAVHELIIIFSFVPVACSAWFGAFPVFLITSLLAAAFDSVFVIVQRYNRSRIIRLLKRRGKI